MKIGNIISDSELVNHDELFYINYYNDIFDKNINYKLPTLFVGWTTLKNSLLNNTFSILNKEIIKNKKYWEFSFEENKASHINGIIKFVDFLPKYYFDDSFKYINIDPIFSNIFECSDIFNAIPSSVEKCYNFKNEVLFILKNEIIYGVDLKMYNSFQFDTECIINEIYKISDENIVDINGDIYMSYYKIIPNYTNLVRYIVTL